MLSKFANDTKWSGAIDTKTGRDAIQRDLDRSEKLAHKNLLRFNNDKCKMLNLGQGKPSFMYKLREEFLESSLVKKDLQVLVD